MPAFTLTSARSVCCALVLALTATWSSASLGQSETTIVGTSDAEQCYEQTRTMPIAGDISICTRALQNKGLDIHDRAATYSNRGILYSQYKEYDKALADHDKAIELMPKLGEAYINRGNVYFHLKEYDKALADYNKAIALKAQPPATGWYNKGLTLIELKRIAEARAALKEAHKLAPDSIPIKVKLDSLGG